MKDPATWVFIMWGFLWAMFGFIGGLVVGRIIG